MDGFDRVKNYSRMIEEVLLTRQMPPYDADPDHGRFANAHRLSNDEVQTLIRWTQAGASRGDGMDPLTEPLPPLQGWVLGKPDAVMKLAEVQQIPATGVLDYRNLKLDTKFTNEVWIAAMYVKPSNRKVVHHVILYAKWPGSPDDGTGHGVHVGGWAPGLPPLPYPNGVAKRLPAGATLTAEVHYSTCGWPLTAQSQLAFYFAYGPQPFKAETRRAEDPALHIPPGSDEARHQATYAFKKPTVVYFLMPHMHLRGKWMRY